MNTVLIGIANNSLQNSKMKVAEKIEVYQGTEVDLIVSDDHTLIVVPQKKKPTLEELLAQCKPENRHNEIDFGREGKELI